jgi:uncharacterized cupredoxin-like copper-binding protein
MRSPRINCIRVVIAAAALVSTACVADDPDPNAAVVPPGGTVEVLMSEFNYLPSSLSFVAGSTVNITLINDGVVAHEFMLGQTQADGGGYDQDLLAVVLVAADGSGFSTAGVTLGSDDHETDATTDEHADEPTADDHETDAMTDEEMAAMDGGGHAGHSGAAVTVEAGGRVELELRIPADASGDWEFGCFIEGHYEAGMHGTMTVPASTT